jgi:threonine/homoserine/homoserine lactone efflux protein
VAAELSPFLAVSILVIVTPGPDTAVTIRSALLGGRGSGIATAAGVAAGQTVWACATSLGVVGLLLASEPVFAAVKYAGAAYLVWLGLQALTAACRPQRPPAVPQAAGDGSRLTPARAFRDGLVSDLGNPKMAVFFTSLLPQFVPPGHATFAAFFTLGLAFSALTLSWLVLYAIAVARAGDLLRRPRIRRTLEGLTGAVLIALGLRLAVEEG